MSKERTQKTHLIVDGNLLARKSFYKFKDLTTTITLENLKAISVDSAKAERKKRKIAKDYEKEFRSKGSGKKIKIEENGKIDSKIRELQEKGSAIDIHTGVLFGMLRSILIANRKYITGKTVICYDPVYSQEEPVLPYRKEVYSNYKNRPKDQSQEDIFNQGLLLAQSFFYQAGIKQTKTESFEADDLLHYYTHKVFKDDKCVVLTNDHDLFQLLVPDRVTMLRLGTSPEIFTAANFKSKYGIKAGLWSQVQALGGCSTDNVGGVYGISSDTACKLIEQFGSLNELLRQFKAKNSDIIKRVMTALTKEKDQNWKNLKQSRQLTKLYGLDPLLNQHKSVIKSKKSVKVNQEQARIFLIALAFMSFLSEKGVSDLNQFIAKNANKKKKKGE